MPSARYLPFSMASSRQNSDANQLSLCVNDERARIMNIKNRKALRSRTKIAKIKDTLAVLCILTSLWLVFFGNLLEREPSKATMVVFFVCWISSSVLAFLPIISAVRGETENFLTRVSETQWGLMICVFAASHGPALLTLQIPGYEGKSILTHCLPGRGCPGIRCAAVRFWQNFWTSQDCTFVVAIKNLGRLSGRHLNIQYSWRGPVVDDTIRHLASVLCVLSDRSQGVLWWTGDVGYQARQGCQRLGAPYWWARWLC